MDHEARLLEALVPLCEPAHDSLASAHAIAAERLPELMAHNRVRPTFIHALRGFAYLELEKRDLGPWRLVPQNNTGIALAHGHVSLRLLHMPRGGSVPAPGSNPRRRRAYANPTLDLWEVPERDDLIGLWAESPRGAIDIRVVRPIGGWNFGSAARVDLDFMLPAYGADLSSMSFASVDEDIEVSMPHEGDSSGLAGFGS